MESMKLLFADDPVRQQNDPYYYYKRSFFISLVLATLILIPFVVVDYFRTGSFVFMYYGDYNVQQIPFYEHGVRMVHQGNFGWDWLTDLGSNFIGSYSYYFLGSPFFWIMCLFPASWAPYLMAPIYILKFACAAVTSFAFLQRFVKNKSYAVMGSLLYAFSGFQIYNVFFNQFHEVVVLFPLLLLGIEECVQNDRRGLFAVAVALNAMCNYFMFAGQIVFCIIYFLFRSSHRSFKITAKKFLHLAVESIIGMCIAALLFLPAVLAVMDNPRVGNSFEGIRMFVYYKNFSQRDIYDERYGHIIQSLFFPPDIPSRVNFFYGHETRWASNAVWLPLFGLSGALSYIKSRKWSRYGALLVFLIICALVPFLNSLFYLTNSAYYARTMYMIVLVAVMLTVVALDDESIDFKFGLSFSAVMCGIVTAIAGMQWVKDPDRSSQTFYQVGNEPFAARLWASVAIAFGSLAAVHFITKRYRKTKYFVSMMTTAVCVVIVIYSVVHIYSGKNHSSSLNALVDEAINGEIVLDYDEFYRIDFYRYENFSSKIETTSSKYKYTSVFDNLGIFWQIPSVECFHTVVPPSLMNFYIKVADGRGVGSRNDYKYYGLRPFLSVKYSFIKQASRSKHLGYYSDTATDEEIEKALAVQEEKGYGFSYYDTQSGYSIFEVSDAYFLNMGFSYDYFITETEFELVAKSNRHTLLCKYLVVPDSERDYYAQFMTEAVASSSSTENPNDVNRVPANIDSFKASLIERKEDTCDSFNYTSYGFTAEITLDKANVVFFSVPYESGWTAYVNGEKATVKQVTYGFLSVEGVEGYNKIEFRYRTPGLLPGALLTLAGIIILICYIIYFRKKNYNGNYHFIKESYYETELCDTQDAPVITNTLDLKE